MDMASLLLSWVPSRTSINCRWPRRRTLYLLSQVYRAISNNSRSLRPTLNSSRHIRSDVPWKNWVWLRRKLKTSSVPSRPSSQNHTSLTTSRSNSHLSKINLIYSRQLSNSLVLIANHQGKEEPRQEKTPAMRPRSRMRSFRTRLVLSRKWTWASVASHPISIARLRSQRYYQVPRVRRSGHLIYKYKTTVNNM